MTTATPDRSILEAQATLRKALERQWRAWTALMTELAAEIEAADRANDPEAALFDAPPVAKANLPLATRKALLAVFDARLQATQAEAEVQARQQGTPLPDAEAMRRTLVTHIRRELQGEIHEKGLALVYWQHKLVPFDHRSIQRTSQADYLAAGLNQGASTPSAFQAGLIVGGGVLAMLAAVWLVFGVVLAPAAPRTSGGGAAVAVGNQAVARWDVQAVGGIADLSFQSDGNGSRYPLVICAATDDARRLLGQTITLTGTESLRTYRLDTSGADLQVVACANTQQELARGSLVDAQSAQVIAADTGSVRDVWVRGPADDPQRIPADRMEVAVLADPRLRNATLVLLDGARVAPSTQEEGDSGLTLRYLVPLAAVAQAAGLHHDPTTGLSEIHPLMLPAPEDRRAYLSRVLRIREVQVTGDGNAVQITLLAEARTERGDPLTLTTSDVIAAIGNSTLPLTITPQSLAGDGSPQPITITLAPRPMGTVTLTVGTWRAAVTP